MPITLEYDGDANVIYTTATGVVTFDDVTGYFASLAALHLDPGYRVLADYSRASFGLNQEELAGIAKARRSVHAAGKKTRIAVHCEDDLTFGLGRMYRALLDESRYDVMIFRTRDQARAWLGL